MALVLRWRLDDLGGRRLRRILLLLVRRRRGVPLDGQLAAEVAAGKAEEADADVDAKAHHRSNVIAGRGRLSADPLIALLCSMGSDVAWWRRRMMMMMMM